MQVSFPCFDKVVIIKQILVGFRLFVCSLVVDNIHPFLPLIFFWTIVKRMSMYIHTSIHLPPPCCNAWISWLLGNRRKLGLWCVLWLSWKAETCTELSCKVPYTFAEPNRISIAWHSITDLCTASWEFQLNHGYKQSIGLV